VPELPEATVISEDVRALAAGKEVVRAGIFRDDVSNAGVEEFPRRLVGRRLEDIGRRGKILTLNFGDVVGVVHLVISGRVKLLPAWREPDKEHTALVEFEGGDGDGTVVLAFTKLWLGYFDLYEPRRVEGHPLISRLGPDPFSPEFSPEYLMSVFRRKATIKGLLLDQSVVAGLGNIYVDEVLFAAGVHPIRKANTLSSVETSAISSATRDILGHAIEMRGTTFDSYHDAFGESGKFQYHLKVFNRDGELCYVCGTEIQKLRVAGRGTHVCPVCQPES
jgi:formamidopyrimidine-DNA glycosylase